MIMPAKKTTRSKAPAATKPRVPRKTAKTIRNLRGTVVHARLYSQNPKDPFRIALNPRGQSGDVTVIPVNLIDDNTFIQGIGVLWEVITAAEAREIPYASVGYLGRVDAPQVVRPEDTTLTTADDWDGKGRRAPQDRNVRTRERGSDAPEREFGTGMHTQDLPGSDTALHAQLKAGQDAMPDAVDMTSRRVVIERVKGE
jgi:hypothetical protein